jgi:aerobic-type carbon monoxide dehydrogenase small subunit (CoxS/CutS family)
MEFKIKVNGTYYDVDTDLRKPLLWVLRDDIGFYGAKYSYFKA